MPIAERIIVTVFCELIAKHPMSQHILTQKQLLDPFSSQNFLSLPLFLNRVFVYQRWLRPQYLAMDRQADQLHDQAQRLQPLQHTILLHLHLHRLHNHRVAFPPTFHLGEHRFLRMLRPVRSKILLRFAHPRLFANPKRLSSLASKRMKLTTYHVLIAHVRVII